MTLVHDLRIRSAAPMMQIVSLEIHHITLYLSVLLAILDSRRLLNGMKSEWPAPQSLCKRAHVGIAFSVL